MCLANSNNTLNVVSHTFDFSNYDLPNLTYFQKYDFPWLWLYRLDIILIMTLWSWDQYHDNGLYFPDYEELFSVPPLWHFLGVFLFFSINIFLLYIPCLRIGHCRDSPSCHCCNRNLGEGSSSGLMKSAASLYLLGMVWLRVCGLLHFFLYFILCVPSPYFGEKPLSCSFYMCVPVCAFSRNLESSW